MPQQSAHDPDVQCSLTVQHRPFIGRPLHAAARQGMLSQLWHFLCVISQLNVPLAQGNSTTTKQYHACHQRYCHKCRAEDAHDLWTVSAAFSGLEPQTTKVLVRTDPSASCVTDDTALAPRQKKQAAPSKARAKHVLEEPVIASAPRQKRSR